MARIETYITKLLPLDKDDKWIGTDSSGLKTKNFSPQTIAEFVGVTDGATISGQNVWAWQNYAGPREKGYIGLKNFGGHGDNLADLDQLVFSSSNYAKTYVLDYVSTLLDKRVIIVEVGNHNNFLVADVVALSANTVYTDYNDITLDVLYGNGTIQKEAFYAIAIYPSDGGSVIPGTGDLDYTHSQTIASTEWVINHGLGKYASVQTYNDAGVRIYGRETQDSVNQITVRFGEAITGKAYIN